MIDEKKLIEALKLSNSHHASNSREQSLLDRVIRIVKEQPKIEWIPVEERLPEVEQEVLITTKNGIITTAIYEDGTIDEGDSKWYWNDVNFVYDEEKDIYLIPKGWWEYRHFNHDCIYNNVVDKKVVVWMPLPEPYEGENEE